MRRAASRREAILHADADVFAAHGFRGTALSTIAARVGLASPASCTSSRPKEHLLLDLLAMRHEHDGERV